jgi:hypothetical protein
MPPTTEVGKAARKEANEILRRSLPPMPSIDTSALEQHVADTLQVASRRYSLTIYPTSTRPPDFDPRWVATSHVTIRRDHLSSVPAEFNKLPVKGPPLGLTKEEAAETFSNLLLKLMKTKPVAYTRAITVPKIYAAGDNDEFHIEATLGLYLSKTRFVLVDQAFGPPPKTVFVADIPDNEQITFVADSDQRSDIGLLVAAFSLPENRPKSDIHDEEYSEDVIPYFGYITSLVRRKFIDEAKVFSHVYALSQMPTPRDKKETAAQDRIMRRLCALPTGALGPAYVDAMQLLRKRPKTACEPLIEMTKKLTQT